MPTRSRRSVPGSGSARWLDKTGTVDAYTTARALLAEPTLGPVQALEIYDPLVAKIEAVLEHGRRLVDVRTLILHQLVGDVRRKLRDLVLDAVSSCSRRHRQPETVYHRRRCRGLHPVVKARTRHIGNHSGGGARGARLSLT